MYIETATRVFSHLVYDDNLILTQDKKNLRSLSYMQRISTTHVVSLLKMLHAQPRWQLWITPAKKPSRVWLREVGLPLDKSVFVQATEANITCLTLNALNTANFCAVILFMTRPLTVEEHRNLSQASLRGNAVTLAFIADKQYPVADLLRPFIIH